MTISIFAQPSYMLKGYIHRVSSIIRGEQIAAYMPNARLNPTSGYENDVCIYVKPHIKPGEDFNFAGHPYLDIIDGFALRYTLQKYPEVPAIVVSDMDAQTMSRRVKNKIVCIPQHHINFERARREIDGIRSVGFIGSPPACAYIPNDLRHGLANRNIPLVEHSDMTLRTVVTKFYNKIDVMMIWSPYNAPNKTSLYNPLKIVNAASFGIPTIALDKPVFKEMEGCYIPVTTAEEWLQQLDALRTSKTLYNDMVNVCLEKSEKYHIENIAKLYQQLT